MGLCWGAVGGCLAQDTTSGAGEIPAKSKYPLRLHVLAIDDTHRTVRMQPNWCSGSVPDMSGGESSPCSNSGSAGLGGGDDDFSGSGRGDLVTPPRGTTGLNFSYEGCSRIRVAPGFQGLEARWKKVGSRLEVMVPTDAVTDGAVRWERCTLKVVTQEFVYLRMRNGGIVRVSEEAYWKKPSLRKFLSGGSEQLQRGRRWCRLTTWRGRVRSSRRSDTGCRGDRLSGFGGLTDDDTEDAVPVTGPFENRSFRVKWDGVYVSGISKVSGLRWSAAVVAAKSGGPPLVHSQPGQLTYQPLVLERPIDYNLAFQNWAQLVAGSVPPGPSGIYKDLIVEVLDSAGSLAISYRVYVCWPSGYEGVSALDAAGNVMVVEQLTLQYQSFDRDLSVAPPLT